MASKRFRGKACAYCAELAIATDGEHVLARTFVPVADRANLPKVPACQPCNRAKEKVEDYVAVVTMLGARHPGALDFLRDNLERKARRRPGHLRALGATMREAWERQPSGIALPTATATVDTGRMLEFYRYLVRGLYHHHVGVPLARDAAMHTRMMLADDEAVFVDGTIRAFGPDVQRVAATLGGGVLRYQGLISNIARGTSAWGIELGQMRWAVGNDMPRKLVSRLYVATVPPMIGPTVEP